MERVIGLDLGTAQASVAMLMDGLPALVPDDQGRVTMPAMVAFPEREAPLVGHDARRWRLTDPTRAVSGIRRVLGLDQADPVVAHVAGQAAFKLVAGPSGKACVKLGDTLVATSEVAAPILGALRARVEANTREPVRKAVLVVPAHCGDPVRLALRLAAQIAGLETVRIVSAPMALALRYQQLAGLAGSASRRLLVVSMGAGGVDAAVMDVAASTVRTRSVVGNPQLGAESVDGPLYQRLRDKFRQQHGIDLAEDVVAATRLWGAAESAKVHLGDNPSVEVRLREMAYTDAGAVDLVDEVQHADIQVAVAEMVRRTSELAEAALAAAGVGVGELEGVVLAGGLSRLPGIAEALGQHVRAPVLRDVQHDGAAAEGAARYGQLLLGRAGAMDPLAVTVVDATAHDLCVEAAGALHVVVPRNAPVPTAGTRTFTSVADDQQSLAIRVVQRGPGPDAAVAAVGQLVVDGLDGAERGSQRVDVTLETDADGVVTASAVDPATGRRTAAPVRLGLEALEQDVVTLRMQRGEVRV